MSIDNHRDLAALRAEYETLVPRYTHLIDEVRFAIGKGLERAKLTAVLTSRVKHIDSLLEKVDRKEYGDPLREITDLAGVRVVCRFSSDLAIVEDILKESFSIGQRVDKTALLGTDRMGYLGTHYVVELMPSHKGARYDEISGLKCEVQVKTILQDAWAQIDHSLMYKSQVSIPEKERREMNNISALLEVAQGVFDRTRDVRAKYAEEVERKSARPSEFLSQPIDRETVASYTRHKYPGLPVNERIQEMLLAQIDHDRYRTLKDLDTAIAAASDAVAAYQRESPSLFKAGTDYITKSLGFVDEKFRAKHGFAAVTRKAFVNFAHLVKVPSRVT
jgi:putative GTP pyrophosphokinase